MRGAEHVEEKPIAAPAGPIARLAPGCRQNVRRHARSILYSSKDLPCRCGLGNLARAAGRREVSERAFGNFESNFPISRLCRSYNLPDVVNAAGCPRSRCARMAKTYRNPADLDAAACPGWPRSSRSSIRNDGNGHPLELKRNLLRRHDV